MHGSICGRIENRYDQGLSGGRHSGIRSPQWKNGGKVCIVYID